MHYSNKITVAIESAFLRRKHIDFGIRDDRGREIGAWIILGTETITPDESQRWLADPEAVGHHYTAKVQPTRNEKPFGATIRATRHPDEASAEREARKRAEKTRRRYANKFGPA